MLMYSILDRKLKEYGNVLLQRNDDAIRRVVLEGVRGSGSLAEKYPADFDVFRIGEFDTDTGVVTPAVAPLFIANVYDILHEGDDNGTGK